MLLIFPKPLRASYPYYESFLRKHYLKQVEELELQIAALKNNQAESERIIQELKDAGEKDVPAPEPFDEKKYQLQRLKEKALEAQKMLDEKISASDADTEGK